MAYKFAFLKHKHLSYGPFNKKHNIIKYVRKCDFCKTSIARWKHIDTQDIACDSCVPRDCSCRIFCKRTNPKVFKISNYLYFTDSKGNNLPCEDWIKL